MLPAVVQEAGVDIVSWVNFKSAREANKPIVVVDGERTYVKQRVMVRTQAENVANYVWPIMRDAERLDMGGLGIWSGWTFQALAADLAGVVVHLLDALGFGRVADNSRYG